MTGPERLATLYYLAALATIILGVWLGHVVTLRSWWSWWGDVSPWLRRELRRVVREEVQRERDQKNDRGAES